jgi:hypothetical protein
LPGEFLGDNGIRSNAPPVELSDSLLLLRPETGQMAMDFIYGIFPNLISITVTCLQEVNTFIAHHIIVIDGAVK